MSRKSLASRLMPLVGAVLCGTLCGCLPQSGGGSHGGDAGTWDTGIPDTGECQMQDGELVKPNEGPSGVETFLEPVDPEETGYDYGSKYRILARPHMHSYDGEQIWLHQDEHFVLDLGQLSYGIDDKQVTMMVLFNYEPVPFKVFEVSSSDGYPSLDEVKNTDSTVMRKTRTRMDGEPFNYTLAVPPESFDRGPGLYDMRIVFVPSPTPSDSPIVAQGLKGTDGYAHQVYFGGCLPTQTADVVDVEGETKTWSVMTKSLVAYSEEMFLAPPKSVYDWESLSRPDEAKLRQEFTFDGETLHLTLYALMYDFYETTGTDTEELVYLVFEDARIIRRFRYTPSFTDNTGRRYFRNPEERKAVELEIDTTGKDSATYTVVAFTNPMAPPALHSDRVMMSNTLSFDFR